jgi:hypothetical protein
MTIGTDINITRPPPALQDTSPEDYIKTITTNADNNLQHQEHLKLGRHNKPAICKTPQIINNNVIKELYHKNMNLLPFTINPWAQFGPMLQSFLSTLRCPQQKDWHPDCPYATLMYERASTPPCSLGILTYADIQWSNSKSISRRTFFGNSYTAPTPSLHTIQLMGLGITKAFSSL